MKSKDWVQLKNSTKEELTAKLASLEKNLIDMKFKHSVTKIKNPLEIRTARRLIAKLKTLLKNKQ